MSSELLFGNNENTTNLDQLLAVEIVTTSQPLIQFNTTNMIPSQTQLMHNVSQHYSVTRRQQARRRRRQRQRQRRREQRQEQQPRSQQNQQPRQQTRGQRSRGWFEIEWDHDNWEYLGYPEYMEENTTPLLEAYDWEKMDPKDRWEQEHLIELENILVQEQSSLIQDELEQLQQIEAVQNLPEEEEQQQNDEQLIQLQQWEHHFYMNN
jgi:hypothetical protein